MPTSKRARLSETGELGEEPQEIAQDSGDGSADLKKEARSKANGKDEATLRARQLVWNGELPQEDFADAFWSHHIGISERDYPVAGEEEEDADELPSAIASAPVLTDWKTHTLPLARIKKVRALIEPSPTSTGGQTRSRMQDAGDRGAGPVRESL